MVPLSVDADDSELETFTLSGNVYNSNGDLAAETSIKVDSMTSSWSDNGNITKRFGFSVSKTSF